MLKYILNLTGLIIFGLVFSAQAYSANVNPKKSTDIFLNALQKRDFKTIMSISDEYQEYVNNIKSSAPSFQFDRKISELNKVVEERILNSLITTLIPRSCKWKILEVKKLTSDGYGVYIDIEYTKQDDSPIYDNQILSRTVVMIFLNANTGKIVGTNNESLQEGLFLSKMLPEENAYWKTPIKVVDLHYKYGSAVGKKKNGICSALSILFDINGGVRPFSYSLFVNNLSANNVFKEPFYEIVDNSGANGFYSFEILTDAKFIWPSGTTFPTKLKLIVRDSANQSSEVDFEIGEGNIEQSLKAFSPAEMGFD